ncbi:hypothetical protein GTG28_03225 [Vibrio sp. OCN044]|uniref:Chalcone isomerase domain-containing protein n=1 Tax=Vibrio tetraodonis subsp. pristinus TaxID=2695891 RepID=A0A6L8LR08_9VIBR|nr:chalcone isomerase family protein [Vibrio tetraodonis]MYM58225.1 hypothetical protein [Vibrio tetraodonis subsp. pristinus]
MKYAMMMVAYLTLTASTKASTALEKSPHEWSQWSSVGQAQLSMLFFDIYKSQLLSPDGRYIVGDDITPHPLALSITYQRDISQKQLVKATVEQWDKLGYESSTTSQWAQRLEAIFPDIEEGNNLTYVTDGYHGRFFYTRPNDKAELIGKIEEEAFNDAFLAIWLSPQTEYPSLRRNLIGSY